jgi:STE24 endopeptidase
MTAISVSLPAVDAPRRAGHFGAWRALSAVPAVAGSLLLLQVLAGWMGQWEAAALFGWILSGAAVFSRVGERIAVRVGAGFRRPTRAQAELLAPAWSAALARCGLIEGEADVYVQSSRDPNAFAAGGRSVAVTTGVLAMFQAHRLGEEYLTSILVHELGHHATRATRFSLTTMWLAAPWRFMSRLVVGIGLATVGRRQPLPLLALVVSAGVVVAILQAVDRRQWSVALVLSAVAVSTIVCPLLDAAVSRRAEYAADRYAASVGLGRQLAAALQLLDADTQQRPRMSERSPFSRHPVTDRRVRALLRPPSGQKSVSAPVRT